jgi:hypothetical protein
MFKKRMIVALAAVSIAATAVGVSPVHASSHSSGSECSQIGPAMKEPTTRFFAFVGITFNAQSGLLADLCSPA